MSLKNKKGAALVEYGMLVSGVALISLAAVATFGHKTNDLVATMASILPGAHADDNNPVGSGRFIETAAAGGASGTALVVDAAAIAAGNDGTTARLASNLGIADADLADLVEETP